MRLLTFILILLFINLAVFSQTRGDFYDAYDYNLNNYKGGDGQGEDAGYFKEYKLPPAFKKPPLVTPKNPRLPADTTSLVPPSVGIRKNPNPAAANPATSVINPFTGELNYGAIVNRNQQAQEKKKNTNKNKTAFDNHEPYVESKERRFQIIFFMTLPFALGLTKLIVSFIRYTPSHAWYEQAKHGSYANTQGGSAFVLIGSAGLALGNAMLDSSRYDEYMKNKKETEVPFVPDQKDDLSFYRSSKRDYRFSITLGEKSF